MFISGFNNYDKNLKRKQKVNNIRLNIDNSVHPKIKKIKKIKTLKGQNFQSSLN